MSSKYKANKIRNIVSLHVIIVLMIMFQFNVADKSNSIPLIHDYFLCESAFADSTGTVNIKVSFSFDADLDGSLLVDGRDLALLMYYFGKTESEYSANSFNVNPDINGDKIVDGDDLVILASHFGLKK